LRGARRVTATASGPLADQAMALERTAGSREITSEEGHMPIRCITRRNRDGTPGAGRTGRMAAGRRVRVAEVSISSDTAMIRKGLAEAAGDMVGTALADTLPEGLEDLAAEGTRRPRRATSVGEAGILVEAADTPVVATGAVAIRAVAATGITTKSKRRSA
jgi:hypothetical protein